MGYGTNRNTARMMELPQTKVVHIQENQQNVHPHPAEFLQGDKGTRLVSDQDKGSRPKYARVHFVSSMFYAKEEKAKFELENES